MDILQMREVLMLWELIWSMIRFMNFRALYLWVLIALPACAPMQDGVNDGQGSLPTQYETGSEVAGGGRSVSAGQQAVYFSKQSSELSPGERRKLEALATMMRMDKSLRAHLAGSTEHGTRNLSLALRRAIAVRNILSQMGVPPSRFSVKDEMQSDRILSQQRPEAGDDPDGRRVDIVIEAVTGQAI